MMDRQIGALEIIALQQERCVRDPGGGERHAVEDVEDRGLAAPSNADAITIEGLTSHLEVRHREG